jgi:hypothetical protein
MVWRRGGRGERVLIKEAEERTGTERREGRGVDMRLWTQSAHVSRGMQLQRGDGVVEVVVVVVVDVVLVSSRVAHAQSSSHSASLGCCWWCHANARAERRGRWRHWREKGGSWCAEDKDRRQVRRGAAIEGCPKGQGEKAPASSRRAGSGRRKRDDRHLSGFFCMRPASWLP